MMEAFAVKNTYGQLLTGSENLSQFDYELQAYKIGLTEEQGGLGAWRHLLNIIELLWPEDSREPFYIIESVPKFAKAFCENQMSCFMGNASSCKTGFMSRVAIVQWLCDPLRNKVVAVSTEIKGAKNRIWGQIVRAFNGCIIPLPGKVYMTGEIRPIDPETGKPMPSGDAGLELVAGNANKEKEAESKIQGFKVGSFTFTLIVDEATKVATGLSETFVGNVMSNPRAKMVMLANFESPTDPFGVMVEPEDGFNSVNVDTGEWRSKRGAWVVHVDGLKATNWLEKEDVYPFLQSWTHIQRFIDTGEENTANWWKFVRSFWAPTSTGRKGYYEFGVLVAKNATAHIDNGLVANIQLFGGLDQSYTSSGDDAIIKIIRLCDMVDGSRLLDFGLDPIKLIIDAANEERTGSYQICDQTKAVIEEYGIPFENFGFDLTGASSFSDMVRKEVSPKLTGITNAGAASSLRSGPMDHEGRNPITNNRRFYTRVDENWCVPLDYVSAGVVRGFKGAELAQATGRLLLDSKTNQENEPLTRVEDKEAYKKRNRGRSPNEMDALCIAVQVMLRRTQMGAYKFQEVVDTRPKRPIDPLVQFLQSAKPRGRTGGRPVLSGDMRPDDAKKYLTSNLPTIKSNLLKTMFGTRK